jgi:hypothetical protein
MSDEIDGVSNEIGVFDLLLVVGHHQVNQPDQAHKHASLYALYVCSQSLVWMSYSINCDYSMAAAAVDTDIQLFQLVFVLGIGIDANSFSQLNDALVMHTVEKCCPYKSYDDQQ